MHPQARVADAPRDQTLALRSFAFDRLSAMAVVLDHSGTIVDTNEAWRLSAHLNDASALTTGPGVDYLEVCDRAAAAGAEGAAAVAAGLRQILSGERQHFDLEYGCPSPTEDRWFLVRASSAPVSHGAGVVLFHVDVTAHRVLQDHLVAHAGRDELTGLPDRASAGRFLEVELAAGQGVGAPVWVLSVGVCGLGAVNDTYGRHVGDELLVRVAARARRSVRQGDLLFRGDGNELGLVCPVLHETGAAAVAARLRDAMSQPFQFDAAAVVVGVAVGFASSRPGSTADTLFHEAAAARHLDPGDGPPAAAPEAPGTDRRTVRPPGAATRGDDPPTGRREYLLVELQRARAMAGAIVAHSNDLVVFTGRDGTIEWVSPASRSLFGVEPEELVGRNGLEMIHPEDRERVLADFATVPDLGDHVRTEFRVIDLEGRVRWVEEIATNLIEDPSVGVIVGNLRDITDRKHAEEAVRFQARLLAAAGQAIVAVDTAGIVIYWNDAAAATYGWTADETLGRPISTVLRPTGGWGARADEIRLRLSDGQPWVGEIWVGTKAGTEIPVVVVDTPVFDEAGVRVGTIGVSTDISDRLRSAETAAMLSAIVESSADAIFSSTADGVITTWNAGAEHLYGHTATEIIGAPVSRLVAAAHAGVLDDLMARVRAGETTKNLQAVARRADGGRVHISISISPVVDGSGTVVGASAIVRDVSEGVELRRRIEEDRRRLADAQASARLGSFEIDLDTGAVTRSAELWRIVGLEPGTVDGLTYDHTHPEDRERVRQGVAEAMAGEPDVERTYRIVRPDGEVRWVTSRTSRFDAPGSRVLTGTMLDITERHQAELALAHQATHDPLTGLPNRAGLADGLRSHLAAMTATPGLQQRVAVAFLDLDRFKVINDTLSHAVGDHTLQAVAERLRAGLRPTDLVARFGGDEFVLVRAGVATLAEASELADEAARLLDEPVAVGERSFALTASVGVTLSDPTDSPGSLLRDADAAMYQAKEDGRARTTVFDAASRARAHRRVAIETALGRAVAEGSLRVEYQPVVDLARLELAGFEALLRWDDPTLGTIAPDEFIPIAESSGLIMPIGDWVLDHALGQLAAWHAEDRTRPDLWMAINLSAPQLGQTGLVDRVAGAIAAAGLSAGLVHLEVTESVLMDRVEDAMETLVGLRALGLHLSIDDFGTGYSSFSYLSRLPVDIIKIDRSFVDGLGRGPRQTSIVAALTTLADTLGLTVVAEGIECPEQLRILRELGCAYGQGFLWSGSLGPDDALALIVAGAHS